jgi:hypothetical protein
MRIDIKALNKIVAQCAEIIGRGAQRDWDLGKLIAPVRDQALWKLRVDRNQQQQYRTFHVFCRHELSMTAHEVNRCIRTADAFDREQIAGVPSGVAYKISNVKSARTRARLLLLGSRGVEHEIARLKPAELLYPVFNFTRKFSMSKVADIGSFLVDHPTARLTLRLTVHGFAVTLTEKGLTQVGQHPSLRNAVMDACAAPTPQTQRHRAPEERQRSIMRRA